MFLSRHYLLIISNYKNAGLGSIMNIVAVPNKVKKASTGKSQITS